MHIEIWYIDSMYPVEDKLFNREYNKIVEFESKAFPDDEPPFSILESIFRLMNVLEGPEAPSLFGCRLMSVGDVVFLGDKAYFCATAGWKPCRFSKIARKAMLGVAMAY